MKLISFAWTTPALLAGRKTVTRRQWSTKYATRFKAGEQVKAYDKLPRNFGKPVAVIELLHAPYIELINCAPDGDYEAEGFKFFEEHPDLLPHNAPWQKMDFSVFNDWRYRHHMAGGQPPCYWVVRFNPIEILEVP